MHKKLIIETVKCDIIDARDVKVVALALNAGFEMPAVPVKKVGDQVMLGECIAKSDGELLSVSLSASISGKITNVDVNTSKLNKRVSYISIETNGKKVEPMCMQPLQKIDRNTIRQRMQDAGIVGCGGACYPAYAKIKDNITYENLVVNACVSDYLTCADLSVLYHHFEDIIKGIEVFKNALNISRAYIVVNALSKKLLQSLILQNGIELVYMPNRYGQGDEKIICKKLFGYEKVDNYPSYAGILVYNAQTIYQIARAILYGESVTNRVVTVCGNLVQKAQNYRIAIGSNIEEVILKYGNLKCSYIEYKEREQKTMERFLHLRELKKDLQEKKDANDVDFLRDFVEERKATNAMIFDFLKYERINKARVSFGLLVGGRMFGKIYDGNILNMQKGTYCIEHVNQKTYEKYYKKFSKQQKINFNNNNKNKIK